MLDSMLDTMSNITGKVEDIPIFTLMGIRFRDRVLDKPVTCDLVVNAWPGTGFGTVTEAFRTVSGVYAFHGLPGLREEEKYGGDDVPPVPLGGRKSFFVEITDRSLTFLPVTFSVKLPLPYRGIYRFYRNIDDNPPPPSVEPQYSTVFYLPSAPTRNASPGLAIIRAQMIEQSTGKPAAHAVMEVDVEGTGGVETHVGIADERGCIAVLFPYPALKISLSDSPLSGNPAPLAGPDCPIDIRVLYEPGRQVFPHSFLFNNKKIPEFRSILLQRPGKIRTTFSSVPGIDPVVSQWSTVLEFGRDLVLRTHEAQKKGLWIERHNNEE